MAPSALFDDVESAPTPRRRIVVLVFVLLLVVVALPACRAVRHPRALPFIENDFAGALAEAKRTGRPLVVDVWASWCQPCAKMAIALDDPAVVALRDRFVWVALDSDERANRPVLRRLGLRDLPTLWIIDSTREDVVMTWSSPVHGTTLARLLVAGDAVRTAEPSDKRAVAERWIAALEDPPPANEDERNAFAPLLLDAYRALGTPARAIPLLQQLAANHPNEIRVLEVLGRTLLDAGNLEEARVTAERALSLAKSDEDGLVTSILVADIAGRAGDPTREHLLLERALEHAKRIERDPRARGLRELRERLESRLRQGRSRPAQ